MKTTFRPDLNVHVSVDEANQVRHLRHSQEYWESENDIPMFSAEAYLNKWAEVLQIPAEQLQHLNKKVSHYDPRELGVEYQLDDEKRMFDSSTVGFYQTFMNTPVWRKGLSVTIKQSPNRVVGSSKNSEDDLRGTLPDKNAIEKYKAIFRQAILRNVAIDPALGTSKAEGNDETAEFVRSVLGVKPPNAGRGDDTQMLSGKFFIYKYDPRKRYSGMPSPPERNPKEDIPEDIEIPIPKLPPVSEKIRPGQAYLVAEIVFISSLGGFGGVSWLILVEIETGSILYIECMTSGVNGLVFKRDPMVKTGDLTITSDDSNAALNMQRDDVTLTNLSAPVAGTQSLTGTFVTISEQESPSVAAPTQATGVDFDYDARTNHFGAVNAYYHQTELFKTIESLGFPVATYLSGTTFPIPVDHRGLGNVINAHCVGNTSGTLHMCYALCDTTNIAEPLCRAVDPWVHWHEMGGHGLLYDHVGSANLGFAHSAGDGLAAIQMDPESALRAMPERFRYAPFRPFTSERRFDRDVATWAWGSAVVGTACSSALISGDDGCYGSEQILATCHFRIYRSLGGDANDVNRRRFASRATTYLILRTIGSLTPMTNPNDPDVWCEVMQDADLLNWTSEGLDGGAYNKVIRWAFEKQGSYQPPGAPTPVTTPGTPPAVDVYIDDGRAGEYQYLYAHWHNQSMWNRNSSDGLTGHENGIDGQTNFMYGKVKNRGTSVANNVTVRAYHTKPGAGLTWPNDFVEMNPIGGLVIPSIPANSAGDVQVGPFEWEPNINAYGHDCVLMIASVAGDPSNIDNFTGSESIQEWRLVPHDNNVGQRNISVVPGAGGGEGLMLALHGAFFMAGNNLKRRAIMELRVDMPEVLAKKGWELQFDGISENRFVLKAGGKRRIHLKLKKGAEFTKADIEGAKDTMIQVSLLANGILLGGMAYHIDPRLEKPSGGKRPSGKGCEIAAERLLDCLKIPGSNKVKKVSVKNVSLNIELDNNCVGD